MRASPTVTVCWRLLGGVAFLQLGLTACKRNAQDQPRGGDIVVGLCDTVSNVRSPVPASLPAITAPRPGTGALIGVMTDRQTDAALALVVVRGNGPQNWAVRSDSSGGFRAVDLTPGRYEVVVTRIGYEVVRDTVSIVAGRINTLRVPLRYRSCP
jgi:hypothetical protein